MNDYTVKLAMAIVQFSLISAPSSAGNQSFTNVELQCPFLQEFNWTQHQCVCTHKVYPFSCKLRELPLGYCMTYNESTDILSSGLCPYRPDFNGNISLDTNKITLNFSSIQTLHDLNEAMCGHLNREGLLCGKCRLNYGTALYSKTFQCVPCDKNEVWMWVLYLMLEIVPLTGLYFAVVLFNIQATSPPFTAFLFHHQFLSFLNSISVYHVLLGYHANQTLLKLTVAVMDMWNLDVLRHLVPPFCVSSSLSNFQVHVIRLVSALYPLVLVVASYLLIELHARNCKVVVFLWNPFHKCFAHFRRKWDPKSSNITAFSTFITLTVLKLWFAMLAFFQPNAIKSDRTLPRKNSLTLDPYTHFRSFTDFGYIVPVVLVSVLVIAIPTAILCLYPIQLCRKSCCFCELQLFKFFVDTFQGHYKDGTGGTRDYRAVPSIVLILRVLAGITLYPNTSRSSSYSTHIPSTVMVLVLNGISLFYAIAQPCKKKYMNNLESIIYAFIGASFLCITNASLHSKFLGRNLRSTIANTFLLIQLIPSSVLLIKFTQMIFVKIAAGKFPRKLKCALRHKSSTDSLPDRIAHPNQYTHLI